LAIPLHNRLSIAYFISFDNQRSRYFILKSAINQIFCDAL